ncbi:MAG: hypothetical protein H6721_04180 [Sandaracinus sp.]|nr:hypothetical protein [Sandaracinus sp.]MCB9631322.1 hypothetical protein [Sandaracinus sp.]
MHPRLITENACVALTRRTSFRKAFLMPWAGASSASCGSARWDEVGQTFAYAAALAQHRTKLAWHQLVLVGTHHHSQATPRDRELAEATRVLHRTMSCALNGLLRERGFEAPGSIWDKRQTHWTTLVDAPAVSSRLVYDDLNNVAAGWVAHPLEVPFGHHLGFELWKAGGLAVPRPDNGAFGKRAPKELELRLTPPIALWRAYEGDVDAMVAALREGRAEELARMAKARFGPVRGVEAMRAVHPWDEPDTPREDVGLVPSFAVGDRSEEGRRVQVQCARDVTGYRGSHRRRVDAWKEGDRTSPFPAGTLLGHTFLGMALDVAGDEAILGRPHPTREEVDAELAEKRVRRARFDAERRERLRLREERRERARFHAEEEALARDLEDEARRVRMPSDVRRAPSASDFVAQLLPKRVTRRGLGEPRPLAARGGRVVVLRAGDVKSPSKRRRRRGSNDPPE